MRTRGTPLADSNIFMCRPLTLSIVRLSYFFYTLRRSYFSVWWVAELLFNFLGRLEFSRRDISHTSGVPT